MKLINIAGNKNYYITECGKIYNSERGFDKPLSQTVNWKYYSVKLKIGGKEFHRHVHRLLALTFLPREDGKDYVNHKDGDKLNNSLGNLEWVTFKENMEHAARTGLTADSSGENNGRAILSEKEVIEIFESLSEGTSSKSLAIRYGVDPSTIANIKQKKAWKNLLQGFPDITVPEKSKSADIETVEEICKLLERGVNPTPISKKLGIKVDVVYDIKRRKSFKDISNKYKW